MKRVMVVTNSLTGGGAERSMNLLVNELSARGMHVSLVPINAGDQDLIEPICEVFPIERRWRGGIFESISAIWRFNSVVREWRPEILILNCDLPELFGALLLGRPKIVVVEHTTRPWNTRILFGRIIRKILKFRGASWVAVSAHLNLWPDSMKPRAVLENALTPSDIRHQPVGTANTIKRLVYIGRLSPEKRPEWVLEIGLKSRIPALFIGNGTLLPALQEEAKSKDLKVIFEGYEREPWSAFQAGDLLVVPSAWEGDGLVVVEALNENLPLLVADIADFRRFELSEKNYCGNIDEFVARIEKYRDHLDELLVPEALRNPILAKRSLRAVGDKWELFLSSI